MSNDIDVNSIDAILSTDLTSVRVHAGGNYVPNIFPTESAVKLYPYRIAVIGEAPGREETDIGLPFVGASGRHLWMEASKHGIVREACYVGNLCPYRPPENDFKYFFGRPELNEGINSLNADLIKFKPNLILLVGAWPLWWAMNQNASIHSYRGSIFSHWSLGFKCLATLHPSGILRSNYTDNHLFQFDLRRARQEGSTPDLNLPERNLVVNQSPTDVLISLDGLYGCYEGKIVSCDIEGYVDAMSCISFATDPYNAFIVPMGAGFWGDLEPLMWQKLARFLSSPKHPKVFQNCLYDMFILQWSYKIPVRGVVDDTMLKHWELYCEIEKNLGTQASIYTREPYYKEDRTKDKDSLAVFYRYCCKDSAVTHEINTVLENQLNRPLSLPQYSHYRFNFALIEPLLYMQLKGLNYDRIKAHERATETHNTVYRLQWALNKLSGRGQYTPDQWFNVSADAVCFKKTRACVQGPANLLNHTKTSCLDVAHRLVEVFSTVLDKSRPADIRLLGELSMLVASAETGPGATDRKRLHCLNVDSSDQIADYLYRELLFPIQYKKVGGRLTDKETTDVTALLTLYKKTNDPTLKLILVIRALRTRLENLEAKVDNDGRIRCSYNAVGTETGRLSCYESITGSGFNLQTATKKDRDLFLPDEGYWLFQCDLSGADGWTVAAHCRANGDPTMWDDYLFGLKPAKIIAAMYTFGEEVNSWSREKIKEWCAKVDQDGWLYFTCKRVQHGSNYGLGNDTMVNVILKDSYKLLGEPILLEPSVCGRLRELYLKRYPGIHRWHAKLKFQLESKGYLISASGHKRDFFGRKKGEGAHETFRAMCSDEPQNNTTYATNLALHKLWTDPENRYGETTTENRNFSSGDGVSVRQSLRIQPLHTIHDALLGQFRKSDTAWAVPRIKHYFQNVLVIAGQKIIIPFEGAYGPNWRDLGKKYGGGSI